MAQQEPFNPDATTHDELMASRAPWFIDVEIRAAKGERLSRDEHDLLKQFIEIHKHVSFERNVDVPY